MQKIVVNSITYSYNFLSADLYEILDLLTDKKPILAAKYCAERVLKDVENTENNAPLRVKLGMAVLQDIMTNAMQDIDIVKNVPAPSSEQKLA